MLHLIMDILEETNIKMMAEIKRGILEKLDSKFDDGTLQLMRKATCIDALHLDLISQVSLRWWHNGKIGKPSHLYASEWRRRKKYRKFRTIERT